MVRDPSIVSPSLTGVFPVLWERESSLYVLLFFVAAGVEDGCFPQD